MQKIAEIENKIHLAREGAKSVAKFYTVQKSGQSKECFNWSRDLRADHPSLNIEAQGILPIVVFT